MKKYLIKRDNLILAELDPKAEYLMLVDESRVGNLKGLRFAKGMKIQCLWVTGNPRAAIRFVKVPQITDG